MPLYPFICDECDEQTEVLGSMADPPVELDCPACGAIMRRDYKAQLTQHTEFVPYVEENGPEGPVQINSRKQQEAFLKRTGCTYDSVTDKGKAPSRYPWENDPAIARQIRDTILS